MPVEDDPAFAGGRSFADPRTGGRLPAMIRVMAAKPTVTALYAAATFLLAADEQVCRHYPATCRAIRPGGPSS